MKRWIRVCLFVIAFCFFVGTMANLAHHHFFGHGLWQPAISCESSTQQIGTISKATAVPCRFRVDNIGRRRLTIHKVLSGCGSCIEVKTFPKEIAPGGSGVICV
ncbi:MAG: DUF1573 domain-containing protein, partial [Deltaproteobacteria bacterium]|nr:DUF1573 domain-containing protein [Deltaproteobacteria bacterium]